MYFFGWHAECHPPISRAKKHGIVPCGTVLRRGIILCGFSAERAALRREMFLYGASAERTVLPREMILCGVSAERAALRREMIPYGASAKKKIPHRRFGLCAMHRPHTGRSCKGNVSSQGAYPGIRSAGASRVGIPSFDAAEQLPLQNGRACSSFAHTDISIIACVCKECKVFGDSSRQIVPRSCNFYKLPGAFRTLRKEGERKRLLRNDRICPMRV